MFKITIEETNLVKVIEGKKWEQIGTKEVERERHLISDQDDAKTRLNPVFGYTPEIEKQEYQTRTILTQQVETIDLAAIIKAINKL